MNLKFRGGSAFAQRLREQVTEKPKAVGRALRQVAESKATECKRRTPVQFGDLRNSIHVEGPFFEGRKIYCQIVAGGEAAPYAIYVHEDLDAHHKVGQAKFIESVVQESANTLLSEVADRLREE